MRKGVAGGTWGLLCCMHRRCMHVYEAACCYHLSLPGLPCPILNTCMQQTRGLDVTFVGCPFTALSTLLASQIQIQQLPHEVGISCTGCRSFATAVVWQIVIGAVLNQQPNDLDTSWTGCTRQSRIPIYVCHILAHGSIQQ